MRQKFLSKAEINAFETPPKFDSAARKKYFSFPKEILGVAENLRSKTNQVCFLVAYGYFKATFRFYPNNFEKKDMAFVAKSCGIDIHNIDSKAYDRVSFSRHKDILLEHFGFRAFDDKAQIVVIEKAKQLARSQVRPKLIFLTVMDLLFREKIELPTYHSLSTCIKTGLDQHNASLEETIESHLGEDTRKLLETLFEKDEKKETIHRVTLLKKFSHSTRPSKIKRNVSYLLELKSIYQQIEPVLLQLDLTAEGINYYAGSVLKSQVFQMTRKTSPSIYLHAMTFIAHQYYRLQDLLADTLLTVCQSANNSTEREYARTYYENRKNREQAIGDFLDASEKHTKILDDIAAVVYKRSLTAVKKIGQIKKFLTERKSLREQYKSELREAKEINVKNQSKEDYFELLKSRSKKLQCRVSEIVKHLEFESDDSDNATLAAIKAYQQKEVEVYVKSPVDFLTSDEKKSAYINNKIQPSLYKIFLYLHVAEEIQAGQINIKNSYRYKSLNDYMISKVRWVENRSAYLEKAGLTEFSDVDATLATLQTTMEKQYKIVNENIANGKNKWITVKDDGSYVLKTPKIDKEESENRLSDYFPDDDAISLTEILSTLQKATHFLDEFEHWQNKSLKKRPHDRVFYAGLIGYGCQHGTNRIHKIANGINKNELISTINGYFSLESINNSIDVLLKFMDSLSLPNVYRKNKDTLHTSSDGQKYTVLVDSLNANYSFKYLGKEKGVSVYTFIDERFFMFHSTVISASERESHYMIDGLMLNDIIKSDMHSTDTHGYSDCIEASMYLLGIPFAPRLKGLSKRLLYSLDSTSYYKKKNYAILPNEKINTKLIKENWDDILRFIATIRLKETTASQLFKRLNSYSHGNKLYEALKEFGKAPKTIFMLKYIDEVEFRQAIEKQLNKIELSNKFSKALSVGSTKGIPHSDKDDQEIAEACKRLLRNALICWNYMYMSNAIANEPDVEKRKIIIKIVESGSIISWRHFNFYGIYDFSDNKLIDSIGFNLPKILGLELP